MFHKISSFLLVAAIASLVACGADEGDDTEGFECSISVSPTEFQYAVVGDSLTFIQTGVASTMTVERQGSGNGLYGDWLLSAETDQYTGLSQRTGPVYGSEPKDGYAHRTQASNCCRHLRLRRPECRGYRLEQSDYHGRLYRHSGTRRSDRYLLTSPLPPRSFARRRHNPRQRMRKFCTNPSDRPDRGENARVLSALVGRRSGCQLSVFAQMGPQCRNSPPIGTAAYPSDEDDG
jgi:hypothetical protein